MVMKCKERMRPHLDSLFFFSMATSVFHAICHQSVLQTRDILIWQAQLQWAPAQRNSYRVRMHACKWNEHWL